MPSGEMPGGLGNTSGDAGALCAPERPQHSGDTGGGQPPSTTVPPLRHPGLQEGAQRAPLGDQPVQYGDGVQEETAGGAEMRKILERAFHAYGKQMRVVPDI